MLNLIAAESAHLLYAAAQAAVRPSPSLLDLIRSGGTVGYIIIFLSFIAMAMAVMHMVRIREAALAPIYLVEELNSLLLKGKVDEAIRVCDDEANSCFLTNVMAAGLSRYRRSPFGSLELKSALEESGQEQIARLYRSTDGMALVAGIAPMLGLLGTVIGINGAFSTISSAEGFGRPDQLAGDISLALVTTIMGLVLAIPTTAAVTYFRNRIDSVASDIAAVVDDLASHIEYEGVSAARPGAVASPAAGTMRGSVAGAPRTGGGVHSEPSPSAAQPKPPGSQA